MNTDHHSETMSNPSVVSSASLGYDPFRGGFLLGFDGCGGAAGSNLFSGLMGVSATADCRVIGIGSDWGYGGLLLKSLHHVPNRPYASLPKGRFTLAAHGAQVGPILIRQNPQHFELWFGSAPLEAPATHHDAQWLASVWLAAERVDNGYPMPPHLGGHKERPVAVGIRLAFTRLSVIYPVTSLSLWQEDIR